VRHLIDVLFSCTLQCNSYSDIIDVLFSCTLQCNSYSDTYDNTFPRASGDTLIVKIDESIRSETNVHSLPIHLTLIYGSAIWIRHHVCDVTCQVQPYSDLKNEPSSVKKHPSSGTFGFVSSDRTRRVTNLLTGFFTILQFDVF